MHAIATSTAADSAPRLRCLPTGGAGAAAPAAHPEQILADLCESLMITGVDGGYVHAEVAMTPYLHGQLRDWWGARMDDPPPALYLVA